MFADLKSINYTSIEIVIKKQKIKKFQTKLVKI